MTSSINRPMLLILIVATIFIVGAGTIAQAEDDWLWSIAPYIWASDISEDLLIRDTIEGGGDTDFKEISDIADTAVQLHFEGSKDRWGMFGDLTYIELSDSGTGELGLLQFDVDIKEVLFEAGAIYRPGGRTGKLDLLFGTRYLSIDEKYRLQLADRDPLETRVDDGYIDAMFGLRYQIPFAERWLISLKGDISTGQTDYIWTTQAMVGWIFGAKRNSGVFLGYRYRDMKYDKGEEIQVRKNLSGFGLGLKIGF